jgi:PmbA protein
LERVLACRDADPAPGRLPRELTVVLPPDHAARILQGLAGAMSAARVLGERSCLAGQLGKMIGSELLNIIDDGTLPGGLGSAPVDAEGVPSAYHHPVLNGRLTSYLSDTASARRMQVASTGNTARQDFRHPPAIRPRNFLLCPGHRTPEDIVGAIDHGLLVFEVVSPTARWVDVASGRITLAAYGRLIEHGKLGRTVVVPLAGSLLEVLAGLSAVAHDVTWSGTIASPTIAVDGFRVG